MTGFWEDDPEAVPLDELRRYTRHHCKHRSQRAVAAEIGIGRTTLNLFVTVENRKPHPRVRHRQAAPLGLAGEWFRQLSGVLQAIGDRSTAAGSVHDARAAVEFLIAALPAAKRERARAVLLADLEALHALAGPPPPEWLDLLKAYFAGHADDAIPSEA